MEGLLTRTTYDQKGSTCGRTFSLSRRRKPYTAPLDLLIATTMRPTSSLLSSVTGTRHNGSIEALE